LKKDTHLNITASASLFESGKAIHYEETIHGTATKDGAEVISMVVSAILNKQIAGQLGTAENTVKVHRSRAMEKMHAQSLAELVRMVEKVKPLSQEALLWNEEGNAPRRLQSTAVG